MHYGELAAYLSLNRFGFKFLGAIFLAAIFLGTNLFKFSPDISAFSEIQLVCDQRQRMDGWTEGRADGRTHPLIEMRERI